MKISRHVNEAVTTRTGKFTTNSRRLRRRPGLIDGLLPGKATVPETEIRGKGAKVYKATQTSSLCRRRTHRGGGRTAGFGMVYDSWDHAERHGPNTDSRDVARVGRRPREQRKGHEDRGGSGLQRPVLGPQEGGGRFCRDFTCGDGAAFPESAHQLRTQNKKSLGPSRTGMFLALPLPVAQVVEEGVAYRLLEASSGACAGDGPSTCHPAPALALPSPVRPAQSGAVGSCQVLLASPFSGACLAL